MAHTISPAVPNTANDKPADVKIILLGDSAVGKSKLVERFLLDDFHPQQLSTFALTLYRHTCQNPLPKEKRLGPLTCKDMIDLEIWDTAGQERFQTLHPSYYHMAHCCILCFDVTRKITYKNLDTWYRELTRYRGFGIPIVLLANKIDLEPNRASKTYGFVEQRKQERHGDFPVYFASASDGTNVVAAFKDAMKRALIYKENPSHIKSPSGSEEDAANEILRFIEEESTREDGIFKRSHNTLKSDMAYSDDELDSHIVSAPNDKKTSSVGIV